MIKTLRFILIIIVLAVMAWGCGKTPYAYHPQRTQEEFNRDDAECGIKADEMYYRAGGGRRGSSISQELGARGAQKRTWCRCMLLKGWMTKNCD